MITSILIFEFNESEDNIEHRKDEQHLIHHVITREVVQFVPTSALNCLARRLLTLYDKFKDVSCIQGRLTDVAFNRSDNYTFASFQCMLVCKSDDENPQKTQNNKEERNQPLNFTNRLDNQ